MREPQGVLGEIVASKRAELAQRLAGVSLDALRARARRTRLSLSQAIAEPGARFILEIKKASPSQGTIRSGADPRALARSYAGVADALSVLADGPFFGGSLADIAAARSAFDGPILAKDFFIDPRQVPEARIAGADAVLVMLSVLDDDEARAMIAEAQRLDMDALVEVHDEGEMRRALVLGATLIGINNRDLRDLSIDLATTKRLAPLASGRLLVSESGISTRDQVDSLGGMVDGFLIGSSLMGSPNPAQSARAMIFGRVKLCGLNRGDDIAAGSRACFAGLMFVQESPRRIPITQAQELAELSRERGISVVGVFRNESAGQVAEIASALRLAAVQLHGAEDADYVRGLRRILPEDCEFWAAVDAARHLPSCTAADRLLFDNGPGGTGESFDWARVRSHPDLTTSLIAGGIGPHNVRAAAAVGAYAIDVGSAVDQAPGTKSARKVAQLFEALRPASASEVRECA
jgi:indole-3-glycerol phosphate synthase/phosphoribosylanthranilate isomerase